MQQQKVGEERHAFDGKIMPSKINFSDDDSQDP
jgi:hypothetical protein